MQFIENNLIWVIAAAVVVVAIIVIIVVVATRKRKKAKAGEQEMAQALGDTDVSHEEGLVDALEDNVETHDAQPATDANDSANASAVRHGHRLRRSNRGAETEDTSSEPVVQELTAEDLELLLDEPEIMTSVQQRVRTVEGAFNSEIRYVSIDAPVTCGFNFNHVISGYSTRAGHAPGADSTDAKTVYASMRNFEKIKADLKPMDALFMALSAKGAAAIYHVSFPDIEGMLDLLRPFGERSVVLRGVENLALITIEGLQADGTPKEFPVTVRAVTVLRDASTSTGGPNASAKASAMKDSMVLDMSYAPDGTVAKGKIVRWHDRSGYLCEFEWDSFSANYHPTVVKVTDTPGKWRVVFGH